MNVLRRTPIRVWTVKVYAPTSLSDQEGQRISDELTKLEVDIERFIEKELPHNFAVEVNS